MATKRETNLELFRIFLMVVLIMPTHYIMSGGAIGLVDSANLSFNMYVAEIFSRTGRMGNNCFLLITGYFMCTMEFSWRKFWRLVLQVEFYAVVIYLLFVFFKYEDFSLIGFSSFVLTILNGVGTDFMGTFVALYVLTPFINKLINSLTEKEFKKLLLLLIFFFSVCNSMFGRVFEMLGWYITVYLVGACLRKCPPQFLDGRKKIMVFLIGNLIFVFGSIILITYLSQYKEGLLRFVQASIQQSNYLLSLTCATAFFLFFKSMKVPYSSIINKLATTILGVLCIHEHSAEMHHLLYKDIFCVKAHFQDSGFLLYMFGCIIILFLVCAIIDLLRVKLLEKPFFALVYDKIIERNLK